MIYELGPKTYALGPVTNDLAHLTYMTWDPRWTTWRS